MREQSFTIHVTYSSADRAYVANIPDHKFCSAFGATPEQAVREVMRARNLWLSSQQHKCTCRVCASPARRSKIARPFRAHRRPGDPV